MDKIHYKRHPLDQNLPFRVRGKDWHVFMEIKEGGEVVETPPSKVNAASTPS